MKLPEEIKVLGKMYEVRGWKSVESLGEGKFGKCDRNQSIIYIDTQWKAQQVVNTFIHEIMHAVIFEMAIDRKSFEGEEELVNPLTNGLMAVFRDNPVLLDIIRWGAIEKDDIPVEAIDANIVLTRGVTQ